MSEADADTLLSFPCDFPIKVLGESADDFAEVVLAVLATQGFVLPASSMQVRESSGGKYTALTITLRVESKPQLDAVYRALHAHPRVKYLL